MVAQQWVVVVVPLHGERVLRSWLGFCKVFYCISMGFMLIFRKLSKNQELILTITVSLYSGIPAKDWYGCRSYFFFSLWSVEKDVIWKTTLRSVIEAETWLFDVFLKTVNDGEIRFSENRFVFKLFQFLRIPQQNFIL